MQGMIQALQAEKSSLEARLKEALAAQPAVSDPRELARAEDKIRSLQKENETLKMSLSQEKSKTPAAVSANTLEQAQRALADANTKLTEQSKRAEALALEKQALQQRLDSVNPAAWNTNSFEKTRKALEDANRQLAEQNECAAKLKTEKDALAAKVKAMEADTAVVASLRSENQSLKKQLADLGAPHSTATNAFAARVATVPPIAAGLDSRPQNVRLEQALQEAAVNQTALSAMASTSPSVPAAKPSAQKSSAPASSSQTADAARIKQLEKERDEYMKKLDAAIKELYGKKGKAANSRIEAAENQVAILRARLEIYEARQVPYTEEELALFKKPEPKLAEADTRVARKSTSELPPGAVKLAAEAQRFYATRQLDKAEEKYQEVVKQDTKNPTLLANLAAIQMENNHLDEADKHITAAVAAAPEDPFALAILGQLRFRQGRYDDAADALSHAAKLDPRSAQIQNFLGITLGQKGLRGPAETALRKAIQIDPNYGEAHQNLAVIYLTQSPPLVELARWHYQKALAAGTPRNKDLENMFAAKRPGESTP
jgi:cytochrome c-type biogenesis protein CcmH/NrfG